MILDQWYIFPPIFQIYSIVGFKVVFEFITDFAMDQIVAWNGRLSMPLCNLRCRRLH